MKNAKTLLLLGGSRYLLPVIETAHRLGCYVITCDYLPDNIAHRYSDEYCNISIIDKDAVLQMAQEKHIDGIMSFACDPGVTVAAYVAEKMGLPFQCSYQSACILQDKGLFRQFLADHGFNCPHSRRYTDAAAPFAELDYFSWPVIVKPVDSAGSKGVTRVDELDQLAAAIQIALAGSRCEAFIIEDFLTFTGYHSSADALAVDGKLRFITYSDHKFDPQAANRYVPTVVIFPSTMASDAQEYLTRETQRLFELLGVKSGLFNIETCVGSDGKPYLMEVSPRGGGCMITELQQLAYGPDFIEAEVKNALSLPIQEIMPHDLAGTWCETVLHACPGETGKLKGIHIDESVKQKYVKRISMEVKLGDTVKALTGANTALGNLILHFETREELEQTVSNTSEWIQIELENDG